MSQLPSLRLGLAGYGTVGSGLAQIIENNKAHLQARTGCDISIHTIVVRDTTKARETPFPPGAVITNNPDALTTNPDIDVVVEMIGGTTLAGDIIEKAFNAGKHVVTANKALLAETGNKLFALAAEKKRYLGFEASVCGGMPIIDMLKNGLAANELYSIMGILNGTSNYILSEMTKKGLTFDKALSEAQKLGFAEADPTFDIDGIDAAHKLALLIRLGWGVEIPFESIYVKGMSKVDATDIALAKNFGYSIKLIAYAKQHDKGIEAAVFPAFVQETFLLSRVEGAYNAVRVHGSAVGTVFLQGKGAGMLPTGSAIAADIITIAKNKGSFGSNLTNLGYKELPHKADLYPVADVLSPFYIRLLLTDAPGVLRDIAGIMAQNNISIAQAIQKRVDPTSSEDQASFTIMTHIAKMADVDNALACLAQSDFVHAEPISYRVFIRNPLK